MRLLLHYYIDVNKYNFLFTGLLVLLSGFSYTMLVLSLLFGGLVLGLLVYYLTKEQQYYFYFNRGYSRIHLVGFCLLLNTLICLLLYPLFRH